MDLPAQRLLSRALELTRPFRLDVNLEVDLAITFHWDDPLRAASICDAAAERARPRATNAARRSPASPQSSIVTSSCKKPTRDRLEVLALEALRRLEEVDDHAGLSQVWTALGYGVANSRGRMDDWAHAAEPVIDFARRRCPAAGGETTSALGPRWSGGRVRRTRRCRRWTRLLLASRIHCTC